jgi:hypothetical protein
MTKKEKKKFDKMEVALKLIRTWAGFAHEHYDEVGKEWHLTCLMSIRDMADKHLVVKDNGRRRNDTE